MFTIPNLLTASNLFFGCCAIISLQQEQAGSCIVFILLASIVDFLDGFVARKLNQTSAIGTQLDSLSDVVSFGVVPGLICFHILTSLFPGNDIYPYLGFVISIMASFRLARYNVESKGTDLFFIGLPVPANALFYIGILQLHQHDNVVHSFIFQTSVFIFIVLLFSYLMISQIKILKIHFSKTWLQKYAYILIIELLVLISWYWIGAVALSICVLIHILFSIVLNLNQKEIIHT